LNNLGGFFNTSGFQDMEFSGFIQLSSKFQHGGFFNTSGFEDMEFSGLIQLSSKFQQSLKKAKIW
jgi:hypothetical protein